MLRSLKQALNHASQSWSTSLASWCTFILASTTLVTSLGSRLGSREPNAQLEELDTTCNLLSFLEDVMKMADVDPFGEHDKPNESMSEH